MAPLRLVGLDLSLQSPGYAWTSTPAGLPKIDVITVPARSDHPQERVEAVRFMVKRLLAVRPHLVVMEDLFAGKNARTVIKLAKLHGVVEQEIWQAQVPWVMVNQQYRAMYAVGRGNAAKEQVLAAARYVYGGFVGGAARIRGTDDADALILLAMAADYYGSPLVEVDQTKRRALDGVTWPRLKLWDEIGSPPATPTSAANPDRVTSATPPVPAAVFQVASQDRTQVP